MDEDGEMKRPIAGRKTIKSLIKTIGAIYGFSEDDLQSDSRARDLSHVRQEIMWEANKIHGRSFPDIGRVLNRDHTTILHGVRAHEERIKEAEA